MPCISIISIISWSQNTNNTTKSFVTGRLVLSIGCSCERLHLRLNVLLDGSPLSCDGRLDRGYRRHSTTNIYGHKIHVFWKWNIGMHNSFSFNYCSYIIRRNIIFFFFINSKGSWTWNYVGKDRRFNQKGIMYQLTYYHWIRFKLIIHDW